MSKTGGVDKGASSLRCPQCDGSYSRRCKLKEHCLLKHQWDIDKEAPASPSTLQTFQEKREKLLTKAREKKAAKETKKATQVLSREVFGDTSTLSDSEISIVSSDSDDTVEPSDGKQTGPPPSHGGKTVKLSHPEKEKGPP